MFGRFGIIGYPLNHSLSPLLFEGIFRLLNLDYVYIPFQIKEFELKPFLESMKIKGFNGMNVTIPYKERICFLLDQLDESAYRIKAVNTIHFCNGKIKGFNTDFYGFYKSIEEFGGKVKKALILGGGGAGRAVLYAISLLKPEKIYLMERNSLKRERLIKDFNFIENLKLMEWEEKFFNKALEEVDLVINSTPLGMKGFQPLDFNFNFSLAGKIFVDLIYNPPLTDFLLRARSLGARIKNGLDMLIFQAMKSFEIWTGIKTQKRDWEQIYFSIKKKSIENMEENRD